MYNVCVNIIKHWKYAKIKQYSMCVCTPGALMNSCFNYPVILDIKCTCMNEEYVSGY